MISVIVPVYNSESFLPQCLDSLVQQSYGDFEIICVDDGSTDASPDVLKRYALSDERIRVYTKENEGKGAASARNMGLEMASGDYVCFLDSDDFFDSDMLETVSQKAMDVDADVVVWKGKFFDHEKQKVTGECPHPDLYYAPDFEPFSWKDCPEYIFDIGDFYAWNKLFRREILMRNNLRFEAIPISDDQYISVIGMALAERIAVVDRAFVNYRINTGTSQCDSRTKYPGAAYQGTFSIVGKLKELGIYEAVKPSFVNISLRLMREYFDVMTDYASMKKLYDTYWDEVFPNIGALNLTKDYFHDPRLGDWYELIRDNRLEEILFKAARAGGGVMTTAPLRFQVPYDEIPKGSRLVLVGKGLAGRYWYSQLILSQYCDVVCWVGTEEEIPRGLSYDAVIKAR